MRNTPSSTIPAERTFPARRILRTQDAAAYVGLSPSTIEKMRCYGGGPKFIRLGGRAIGYDIADLDRWLEAQANNAAVPGQGQARS